MNVDKIRQTIELAIQQEQESVHLQTMLKQKLNLLHHTISLPGDGNEVEALQAFVVKYIQHVPDFIEAAAEVATEAGIQAYMEPFLDLAEAYFLKPPEIVGNVEGVVGLMDEAYLAHRLIEEVNDRHIPHTGIPLIPMDTTCSNLIVHSIIGEPFANELDEAVHYTVERFMSRESVFNTDEFKAYVEQHKREGWSDIWERWPCLANDSAIGLELGQSASIPLNG